MLSREDRLDRFRQIDLYPVISDEFTDGRGSLATLREIAAGGAKIVQLREKALPKRALYELALAFRSVCDEHDMLLIIDDEIDVAMAAGADGVHLGQDDLPLGPARLMAPELIIGQSTHSIAEAIAAHDAGADYVNLGPIFATSTKQVSCEPLGEEIIQKIAPLLDIPFTVMGGIKAHHIPELLKLDARRIAMVTEITQAEDVAAKVKELRALWNQYPPEA